MPSLKDKRQQVLNDLGGGQKGKNEGGGGRERGKERWQVWDAGGGGGSERLTGS